MRAIVVAVPVLAACWSAPVAPPPTRPPPAPVSHGIVVPGFAEADAIVLLDGTLTTVSFAHDHPKVLGEIRIAPKLPPLPTTMPERIEAPYQYELTGGWADRDHFYVRTARRTVLALTATGSSAVRLPPKAPGEEEPSTWGSPWTTVDLVVDGDGAWWSRCVETGYEDGGRCAAWSSTMLWPRDDRDAHERRPGTGYAFAERAPAGYTLAHGTCTGPDGVAHDLVTDPEEGRGVDYQLWVSASPPRLLVVFGRYGEFSATGNLDFELHDGCGAIVDRGSHAEVGPGDLWAAGSTLYRGGTVLGEIPPGSIHFRPPHT